MVYYLDPLYFQCFYLKFSALLRITIRFVIQITIYFIELIRFPIIYLNTNYLGLGMTFKCQFDYKI